MDRRRVLRHGFVTIAAGMLATIALVGAPVSGATPAPKAQAAGTFTDARFREVPVFTGLTNPTTVRFASDGRAFVAEKAGIVKEFASISDPTPTTVIDLTSVVNSYWDRGLLGLALDPGFLDKASPRPYIYLFYVYDAPPGKTAPAWTPNDSCPTPPGGTTDGCPVTSKLVRYTVNTTTNVADPNSAVELIHDWCQQFPSHSGGGIAFGPDGQLYVTAGDGASFNTDDYGQLGGTLPTPAAPVTSVNPCGDPTTLLAPNPNGTPHTDVATAEGGSLRAQDVRTTGDPTGLDGSLIRIDPTTGAGSAGNPLASSADLNNRRIIAHGFRNPFRLTVRPGTGEIYVGDVGNQTWEEINRIVVPTQPMTPTTLPNYGWPCVEGPSPSDWQTLGNSMCTSLYNQPGALTAPLYTYSHSSSLSPTGPCFIPDSFGSMSSSVTGLAFYEASGNPPYPYPAKYDGALFFVDYSRNCLGALLPGAGGVPDPSTMEQVASSIGHPVDLLTGPGGDLYYVDFSGGRVVEIRYLENPVAAATATPASGAVPLAVTFDGSGSHADPRAGNTIATYEWDFNNDGVYDATGVTATHTFTASGNYPVTLRVADSNGLTDTTSVTVTVGPPVPAIDTPASSLTWKVGDTITFSGHATDGGGHAIPAANLTWDILLEHCPAGCHEHHLETLTGVASGTFAAPDHDYPSWLRLRLTATDSNGLTATTTVDLHPMTTTIAAASAPAGVPILVSTSTVTTPSTVTVILGHQATVSAPATAVVKGASYRFAHWADGSPRTTSVTANGPISLMATYVKDAPDSCAGASTSSPQGSWISDTFGSPIDQDWFRFTLTSKRRVVITLGDLPVDGRLQLYGSCSTLLATSDHAGTQFEELTRVLAAGTYRVRVTANGGATSDLPYVVRFRPMASGMPIKSSRTIVTGGSIRIVGEVLNNTGTTRGPITVKATLRNSAGRTVGTLSGVAFAYRLGDGGVTSFQISGLKPSSYSSVVLSATSASPPSVPAISLRSLVPTQNPDGTVTETGAVKNLSPKGARYVRIARTWYGSRGEVLDRGIGYVTPSTLRAGGSGVFTLTRPVLPTEQAARTETRGAY